MAIMGIHVNKGDGSGLDTSLGDTLAKALFGDPELEMKLALQRQDYESEAWKRRVWDAQVESEQAAAEANAALAAERQYVTQSRQEAAPAIADYQAGLVEQPAPVEVSQTALVPPHKVRTTAIPAADIPVNQPTLGEHLHLGEMPAPVDDVLTRKFAPLAFDAPVAIVTPEDQAAYDREVAARRAQALAVVGAGGNAEQLAKGIGVSEGAVKLESTDPVLRGQGETLYTGKAEAGSSADRAADELRKEVLTKVPAYQKLADVTPIYDSMRKSALIDTKAANMDLVYGIATLEDPGSVVRTGDQVMVQRTGGLSGAVQQMISYFNKNGSLTPQMRADIMQVARNRYEGYRGNFDRTSQQYRRIAEERGLKWENVIPEISIAPVETPRRQDPSEPVVKGTDSDGNPIYDFSHMTTEQFEAWVAAHPELTGEQ
jgi:hypothetical protein